MTHIPGFDRSQLLLLPEAIDDYVSVDNPVRFINAFVDGLDLKAAGFERVEAKATGRPGYAPGDLLKLYIYGYLNRVRSSRRLEAECHRNIEIIWLLGGLKPDFKTIADFRSDNRAAFKKVFRQFVILCRRLDLFGRELLAVDGTRIKAVNNKDRNFTTGSFHTVCEINAFAVVPLGINNPGGGPEANRYSFDLLYDTWSTDEHGTNVVGGG